jgi:RNA 2',3'-cyclic 3'-phosphodiesterase
MRLFVAIDIPDAVREALARLSREWRPLCPEARWVRMEGAHITLKFIGETTSERAENIYAALRLARASAPIHLVFSGLGFFPDARRPRVLWAGVSGNEPLRELAASIQTQLEPLGIARETREFSPHITLARLDSPKQLARLQAAVEKMGTPEFGRHSVHEFRLYQSVLKRGGAEYTCLATYPISGVPNS